MRRRAVQIGDIFGRLMVEDLHSVSEDGKRRTYLCRCECFALKPVQSHDLLSGKVTSCGAGHPRLRWYERPFARKFVPQPLKPCTDAQCWCNNLSLQPT